MNKFKWLTILILLLSAQANASGCVILLHGLVRSSKSMIKLSEAIDKAGFKAVNYNYPSTKYTIEKLAKNTVDNALLRCPKDAEIHFVTHSMGGILIRQYLKENTINNLGHVVMLAPPNKGSQVVDKLHNVLGFKLINGPAGMQLGTGKLSLPNRLGPANFDVGIIAGSRTINLILSTMLPNPNDGKVSVENTKLEGMSDHIVISATHPFIMNNKAAIKQVVFFLKHGKFRRV